MTELANDRPPLSELKWWDIPYPDDARDRVEVVCAVHELQYDDRIGNFAVTGVEPAEFDREGHLPTTVTLSYYGRFKEPHHEEGVETYRHQMRQRKLELRPGDLIRVRRAA